MADAFWQWVTETILTQSSTLEEAERLLDELEDAPAMSQAEVEQHMQAFYARLSKEG